MHYSWAILAACSVAAIATAPGQTLVPSLFHESLREATGVGCGAGTALLAAVASPGTAMAAMGLLGLGQGLVMTVGTTAIARWFGRLHHGSIRGFASSLTIAGTSAGPLLLSGSRDLLDSWSPALLIFGASLAILGVGCAAVRPPVQAVSGG